MTNEDKPREFIIYEQHGELKACEGPKLFIEYSGAKPTKVINTMAKSEYDKVVAERDEYKHAYDAANIYQLTAERDQLLTLVGEVEKEITEAMNHVGWVTAQINNKNKNNCAIKAHQLLDAAIVRINEFRKAGK